MVNVTKENFIEQSNDLLRYLPTAAFVAIDEEMTGISVDKGRPPKDKMPVERYSTLKQAPERYSIIQLGVALFHPMSSRNSQQSAASSAAQASGRGYASVAAVVLPSHATPLRNNNSNQNVDASSPSTEYTVRRYNFYMFPSDSSFKDPDSREVVLNPQTVAFLLKHNMSFDLWTTMGVNFVTTAKANARLDSYSTKERAARTAEAGTHQQPPSVQETIRRRVELRRNDDIEFCARAMASLREWLDGAHDGDDNDNDDFARNNNLDNNNNNNDDDEDGAIGGGGGGEGTSFLMPPCNSFLRRALYESIELEYPTLELESGGNQQIRVWRLNAEEKARRKQRLRREHWQELIGQKLGVWRVFEALRCACSGIEINRSSVLFADSYDQVDWDSPAHEERCQDTGETTTLQARSSANATCRKIPLVVHNGFMDILFLLTHFDAAKLPSVYTECKQLIARHFPIIYDTKVMSTECNCWGENGGNDLSSYNTNLANLFQQVVREPMADGELPLLDQIHVEQARSSMPVVPDQEHEAAYDAYMTGAIFLGLCRRIQHGFTVSPNFVDIIARRDSSEARMFYNRNMLYQMSMYTMDLEETQSTRDPMSRGMLPESTYRVAGFDKAVTTRDIVRCISGLTDSVGRQIQFEIVWIDDTTFLVAASYRSSSANSFTEEMEAILRDHGSHLFRALSERFQQQGSSILVLEDHLRALDEAQKYKDGLQDGVKRSWVDRVLSVFGWTGKRGREEDSEDLSNKRRRVNY